MLLKVIPDFSEAPVCTLAQGVEHMQCALMTTRRQDEAQLAALVEKKGDHVIVPEVWRDVLPQAAIMISSAICGGEAKLRFEDAAARRPCWLLIEPIMAHFPLPCPDGDPEALLCIPEGPSFYSSALCCYYAHRAGSFFLWDTEESIYQKMLLAKRSGFLGYVYPRNKNTAVR